MRGKSSDAENSQEREKETSSLTYGQFVFCCKRIASVHKIRERGRKKSRKWNGEADQRKREPSLKLENSSLDFTVQ